MALVSLGKAQEARFRTPPHDVEAEQAVLGSIFIENEALPRVVELLRPEDFYKRAHGIIYQAMLDLFEENLPQDLVSVRNRLESKGLLEGCGGGAYLAELTEVVPIAANVEYYAKIVRDKAVLRRLIERSSDIATLCYQEAMGVDEILESAEASIFELSDQKIKRSFEPVNEILVSTIRRVEELYNRKELITGVPSGFPDLDGLTAGFQPSDLIIIAGRPSMGKTAFALNCAQNAAIRADTPVAIFSLEMSKEQLVLRMLCSEAKVDAHRLRTGFLGKADWPKLHEAAGRVAEAEIYIDDTPAQTVMEIRAKARRLKSANPRLGLVIIDYLQLMRGRGGAERREQEISEISRSLKAMAKELDLPVIALSQLNRKVEERTDRRPQMADLRESGAIEQDADLIAFIYRDEVYNKRKDNPNRGIAEIILAKQRNGPTGVVKLAFVGKYSTFAPLAKDVEDQ